MPPHLREVYGDTVVTAREAPIFFLSSVLGLIAFPPKLAAAARSAARAGSWWRFQTPAWNLCFWHATCTMLRRSHFSARGKWSRPAPTFPLWWGDAFLLSNRSGKNTLCSIQCTFTARYREKGGGVRRNLLTPVPLIQTHAVNQLTSVKSFPSSFRKRIKQLRTH